MRIFQITVPVQTEFHIKVVAIDERDAKAQVSFILSRSDLCKQCMAAGFIMKDYGPACEVQEVEFDG